MTPRILTGPARPATLLLAAPALTLLVAGCGAAETTADAEGDVAETTTTTSVVGDVAVGDRFSGPGTFRVSVEPLAGNPPAIPPGEYRLRFTTDYSTGADHTTGMWIRCSAMPCEPGNYADNLVDSGIVGVDERTGEPRSRSMESGGSVTEHGTTLEVGRADGALYLRGLSIQLLTKR